MNKTLLIFLLILEFSGCCQFDESPPQDTMPLEGIWNAELLASDTGDECGLFTESSPVPVPLNFYETDGVTGTFSFSTAFKLHPDDPSDFPLEFDCRLSYEVYDADSVPFECDVLDAPYSPDDGLDATFTLSHSFAGDFNLLYIGAGAGGWTGMSGVWDAHVQTGCTGDDCDLIWPEVQNSQEGCDLQLLVDGIWPGCNEDSEDYSCMPWPRP